MVKSVHLATRGQWRRMEDIKNDFETLINEPPISF